MSLLLPEGRLLGCTRVLVAADQLVAEHWSAGWRPRKQLARQPWQGDDLLAALQGLLAQLPASRWRHLTLALADDAVHWLHLPAMASSLQGADVGGHEQQAYAQALLMQTYGEAARHWPFRLQDSHPSQHRLLAALPRLSPPAINRWLATQAIQWSIQPYASLLWAQARLPQHGTLLTAEPQLLRLLQWQAGQVVHVASVRYAYHEAYDVAAWILRERLLLGGQSSPCYWLETGASTATRFGQRLKQALPAALAWQPLRVEAGYGALHEAAHHGA